MSEREPQLAELNIEFLEDTSLEGHRSGRPGWLRKALDFIFRPEDEDPYRNLGTYHTFHKEVEKRRAERKRAVGPLKESSSDSPESR